MTELKTNFFRLYLENGSVRHVKSGQTEIVRMIYSAVRDQNWGTIEPKIIQESIVNNESGFLVKTEVLYQKSEIHFEAVYSIAGKGNYLEFSMEGEAKSSFLTNRVGFCVLHPIKECAGKSCTVFHPDQSSESKVFPEFISPDQPMINISGLEWKPSENLLARISFSGDIFEMEDQRNWTDASYKTYCRPISLPFPFEIKKGDKIRQKIILEIQGESKTEVSDDCISFRIDKTKRFRLPEIGVVATNRKEPVEFSEAGILKQMPIHHLRAEIKLFEKNRIDQIKRVVDESVILEIPLFLVLYISENYNEELTVFQEFFRDKPDFIKYILVVGKNHLFNHLISNEICNGLQNSFPNTKIGAGVNAYFAELNRNRPKTKNADFVSFAVCPQVHAFDNLSLVENLESQKYAVESAIEFFPGKPVFISPVTLKQRFNIVATTSEPEIKPDELPSQVDTRQNSVFAAQWMAGSLKFLAQSGTALVTFFENVGWQGFIQGNYNPPVQHKFGAKKGDVFPVFQLFKEFEGYDEVIFSESNKPLELEGIVLSNKNDRLNGKILLSNFSKEEKSIRLEGIAKTLGINSIFPNESIKTENDEILIPGEAVVKIGIKL